MGRHLGCLHPVTCIFLTLGTPGASFPVQGGAGSPIPPLQLPVAPPPPPPFLDPGTALNLSIPLPWHQDPTEAPFLGTGPLCTPFSCTNPPLPHRDAFSPGISLLSVSRSPHFFGPGSPWTSILAFLSPYCSSKVRIPRTLLPSHLGSPHNSPFLDPGIPKPSSWLSQLTQFPLYFPCELPMAHQPLTLGLPNTFVFPSSPLPALPVSAAVGAHPRGPPMCPKGPL